MTEQKIEFEILEVVDGTDLGVVVLRGLARGEIVSIGMNAKALALSSLYMKATIRGVECNDEEVKLSFDMANPDICEEWLALCQVGDVLWFET